MNRVFFLVSILSFGVNAHSQHPIEINQTVTDAVSQVEINVVNMYDRRQCYQILHNDLPLPNFVCLEAKEKEKVKVWVRNIPDKYAVNQICSLSGVLEGHNIRTKLCTDIKTYYPASQLAAL
ncbi:MAG: hypothetical protein ACRC9R_04020 [Enterovibrio sp.]